jgi:hypothetical protein
MSTRPPDPALRDTLKARAVALEAAANHHGTVTERLFSPISLRDCAAYVWTVHTGGDPALLFLKRKYGETAFGAVGPGAVEWCRRRVQRLQATGIDIPRAARAQAVRP